MPIKKEHILLFLLILIPNFLRQIIYKTTNYFTNSTSFIISFETVKLYSTNYWWITFFQEISIGIIFAILWFKVRPLQFLSYGWIMDSAIDSIVVLFWLLIGSTPFQLLNLSIYSDFLLREIVFPYFIFGLLLWRFKFNIKTTTMIITIFNLFVLSLIIKFGAANLINLI